MEKITNNAEADRSHSFSVEISQPGYENIHSSDTVHPDTGVKEEVHMGRHILLEQIDTHPEGVRELHHEEGTDTDHGPGHHSNDPEGASDDDTHHRHDEGCIRGLEEDHDGCYSIHRWIDNPRDDMVVIENDDGNRSEALRFAPEVSTF